MVKKGKAGDSLYAKNLLSLFWEPEVLENRSVTGRKANSVKDAVPKPRLTPKKLDELKSKLFWFSFSFIHFIYITIVLTILELIDMKKRILFQILCILDDYFNNLTVLIKFVELKTFHNHEN